MFGKLGVALTLPSISINVLFQFYYLKIEQRFILESKIFVILVQIEENWSEIIKVLHSETENKKIKINKFIYKINHQAGILKQLLSESNTQVFNFCYWDGCLK